MGLRKMNPRLSTTIDACGEENYGNRVDVTNSKSVDHWAFLEEFEAPMWADLMSETESPNHHIDDEWFQISHPFHQCSSHQLISMVSLSAEEGCKNPMEGPSSPKLPPSVSKSRGKDYKSREWGQSKFTVISSKQHPVKSLSIKSSLVNLGSGNRLKTISRVEKLQGKEGSKVSSICESSLTEATGPTHFSAISTLEDSKSLSTSLVHQVGGSNSTSTVTCEGSRPEQKKSVEISNHIPGHTSGLMLTLRTSLRRSCVTRQASRAEVNGGRKSEGFRSSSSKSSVGSSSHPGCDGTNLTLGGTQNKEKTPDSRNVMRISQAPRNKPKVPTLSKGPAAQLRVLSSNFRLGDGVTASREITKAKAQQHGLRKKGLVTHRIYEQDSLTTRKAKEKVGVGWGTKVSVDDDKRISSRLVTAGQISYARGKAVGCVGQPQKPATKSNRIGAKEKNTGRSEGMEARNVVKKVYFR